MQCTELVVRKKKTDWLLEFCLGVPWWLARTVARLGDTAGVSPRCVRVPPFPPPPLRHLRFAEPVTLPPFLPTEPETNQSVVGVLHVRSSNRRLVHLYKSLTLASAVSDTRKLYTESDFLKQKPFWKCRCMIGVSEQKSRRIFNKC